MLLVPTYPLSIHPAIIDKSASAGLSASGKGWSPVEFSEAAFASSIRRGIAYAPEYRGGHRKTLNFICAGFLAADVDRDMPLAEAKRHSFVAHNAALIHTTASHTIEQNRCRIIFLLDEPIINVQDWADAQLGLALNLNSDKSVADGGRMFFGNTAAEIYHIGRTTSPSIVADLIMRGRDARASRAPDGSSLPVISARRIAGPELMKVAGGDMVRHDALTANMRVHCPHHADDDPSAFTLLSRTGQLGIHCSACKVTFWSTDGQDGYDFGSFDRLLLKMETRPHQIDADAPGFDRFFPPDPRCSRYQQRFLPSISYEPGITLVKSPKGSGKTEALRFLVNAIRQQLFRSGIPRKERAKSVLLIGHRQSLLREAAKKLGLHCYLDTDDDAPGSIRTLAVTLDSLPKYNEPGSEYAGTRPKPFDLVIIDESEQVFAHLFGETIKNGRGLERCFDALKFEVENAKAVMALDADLGLVTTHALRTMRPQDWHSRCRIIYNSPVVPSKKRIMRLHKNKPFLLRELIEAIKHGEKCFIVSNSKKFIDVAHKMILRECGDGVVMRVITSDNSRDDATVRFLGNITTEFLKVQVVLGTPSIGTGIDITFPLGECRVDRVFGFFYPFVNTHTDIDQQLARVRNPGMIDVWISPATFNFTCNVEIIMDDLARAYVVPRAVRGRNADGMVEYDRNDPLLLICAHVTALRRASKNQLVELFCALREANGWEVQSVSEKAPTGPYDDAKKMLAAERREMLLDAAISSDADFIELDDRVSKGATLTKEERIAHERNQFERAVGVPLDETLVDLNTDGKLLNKVEALARQASIASNPSLHRAFDATLEAASRPNERIRAMKPEYVLALLLRAAALTGEAGLGAVARISFDGLSRFVDVCRKNRTMIEEVFNEPLRGDFAEKPVRQLNLFLKRIGLQLIPVESKTLGGRKVRYYGLPADHLSTMMRLARSYLAIKAENEAAKEAALLNGGRPNKRRREAPASARVVELDDGLLSTVTLWSGPLNRGQ